MSFKVWFRGWIRSFHKLLTLAGGTRKSDRQREKERARRKKAKYENTRLFRNKRERRHTSHNTKSVREAGAVLEFIVYTLGILLLPFGLFDWGYKSAHIYRSNKKVAKSTSATKTESRQTSTAKKQPEAKQTSNAIDKNHTDHTNIPTSARAPFSAPSETESIKVGTDTVKGSNDESLPISTPKHEKDQYIKKRMIIACPSSKDLQVGAYLDMSLEPSDTYGKGAIKLICDGEHIGYVATNDASPFVTCLKIGRRVYGVITNVHVENGEIRYQYEAWVDSQ